MKKIKIPTFLGIVFLVVGIVASVVVVQNRQLLKIGATPSISPHDIRITNVSDNSFAVSWVTDTDTTGFVTFGENQSLGRTSLSDNSSVSTLHYVVLQQLKAATIYFFKINSNSTIFDNAGIAWQTKTGPTLVGQSSNTVLSGTVNTASGIPASNVIIYVSADNVGALSTQTNASGKWVLPLSSARTNDAIGVAQISSTSTLLQIFLQGGPLGVATAQIYPASSNPTPVITLGNNYDFRSQQGNDNSNSPSAQLNLPADNNATNSSGFKTNPLKGQTTGTKKVTIDSVSDGDVIKSSKPEFFGTANAGQTINITVESTPQNTKLTVSSSGVWRWSPPSDLPAGSHTITISWTDAAGILRTLTKLFVVQAANGPSFVSTPSSTLKPTSSPSPTPTPTPTPTLVATATTTPTVTPSILPTIKPTIVPTSTAAALPVAGETTATIALISIALGLFAGSIILFQKIEN